jgi:hypothetical protein
VRASFSGRRNARAARRSRDRGHKGHRILRRVPADGRHLGSSRAFFFHEKMVTVALVASSHGTGARRRPNTFRGRGGCDGGVRGSVASGAVGRQRPRSVHAKQREFEAKRVRMQSAEAVSGVVKTPGPPVNRAEPKTPWGVHAAKAVSQAGNARGTGAGQSFRWQKSVERIERLVRREVARPRGGFHETGR